MKSLRTRRQSSGKGPLIALDDLGAGSPSPKAITPYNRRKTALARLTVRRHEGTCRFRHFLKSRVRQEAQGHGAEKAQRGRTGT